MTDLPVVIYTGTRKWQVTLQINDMIAPVPGLDPYQLHLRYLILDVVTMAESELEMERNLAAVLFRLEKCRAIEAVRALVALLKEWLKAPEQTSLRRAFTIWLRRVLLPKRLPAADIPELTDLHEVDNMLAESVQEWVKPWVDQGRLEGRMEEAAVFLLNQVRRKFGQPPEWVMDKVTSAQVAQIERWGENILFANVLEEVFKT